MRGQEETGCMFPDNMGGNAEAFDECKDKPFVPCVDRTQGRKAFVLVEGEKENRHD